MQSFLVQYFLQNNTYYSELGIARAKAQYQHAYFRNTLKDYGIIQAMSTKENLYNNCIIKTFFEMMKNEMCYGKQNTTDI